MSELLHLRENDPELESFLNENSVKFNGHCLLALKLMYSGVRLTDAKAVTDYGFSGRRLRELHNAFPNKVKKAWMLGEPVEEKDDDGNVIIVRKRKYVEYFIEQPITPTKAAAIAIGQSILDKMNGKQGELFE